MWSTKQHQAFIEEMKEHQERVLKDAIEKEVNGGLRKLQSTMLTSEDFRKYVVVDTKWKEDAQPAIDKVKNLTGAWKFLITLALGVAAIGTGLAALRKILSL